MPAQAMWTFEDEDMEPGQLPGSFNTNRDQAEKEIDIGECVMTKTLFALALAGTLMVPHSTPALGNDSTTGVGGARAGASDQQPWKELPLPFVPELESMPWLTPGSPAENSKVDMLWQPHGDTFNPFWLQPGIPFSKFASSQQPAGGGWIP
jgi:hypothetical protein